MKDWNWLNIIGENHLLCYFIKNCRYRPEKHCFWTRTWRKATVKSSLSYRAQNSLSNSASWRKFYMKVCAHRIKNIACRIILEGWKMTYCDCIVNKISIDGWIALKFCMNILETTSYYMMKIRPILRHLVFEILTKQKISACLSDNFGSHCILSCFETTYAS